MTDYSGSRGELRRDLASQPRICANCGRPVSPDDRYCSGCGVEFGTARVPVDHGSELPGFGYHFIQGLAWGLGFALAAAIVSVMFWTLVAVAMHGVR
jgi:hypothetical protein